MRKLGQILLVLLAVLFIMPILLTLAGSLMTPDEVTRRFAEVIALPGQQQGITLIPDRISISQFYTLLIDKYQYLGMFWNSIKYALIITVLVNFFAIPAAFVFAKIGFKGSKVLFFLYILTMMMPFQVTLLPNYIMLSRLSLLNTVWAIIAPAVFAPFGVFLLHQFIKSIPSELIEAACLETNSVYAILRHVVIPSVKTGIIAMNILVFTECWNMVEQPMIFLDKIVDRPLSSTMNGMLVDNMSVSFAGSVLYILPIILIFLMFEEKIIAGLENLKW